MNYKLAKKLKDAGFPVKDKIITQRVIGKELHIIGYWFTTLSELIEACGNIFVLYSEIYIGMGGREEINWVAKSRNPQVGERFEATGETPEEAVANLWLELNK